MDPTPSKGSVREVLARASGGRPPPNVLAASLASAGWMHCVAPGSEDEPRRVFVDHDALHEHAIGHASLAQRGYTSVARPWAGGLAELLADGCAGIVLDAGRGIELALDRRDLVAVVAALALERFVRERELVVLLVGNKVHFHVDASGEPCGLAFSSLDLARRWSSEARATLPDLRSRQAPAELVFKSLCEAGVQRLVIDPGLPSQAVFERDVLEVLGAVDFAAERSVATATPEKAQPIVQPVGRLVRAQRDNSKATVARAHAPLPPPGRHGALARERMREIRELAARNTASPWIVAECLANDVDLWVPIGARASDGMHWPALVRTRDDASGDRQRAEFYSSEESARRAHAGVAALSGIEAFRWNWSSPHDVSEVVLDPDEGGGWSLTDREVLPLLFPAITPIRDLELVPNEPVERLSKLPWLHGLKPEVVRFFSKTWSTLYGPPLDGSQPPIPFATGMYLPVFSHAERFYEFTRRGAHRAPTPQVAGSKPPFLRWLRLTARCSGIVVDPASSHAFAIETTELFYLHLWASLGRAPDGLGVAQALALLQGGDYSVDQRTAGRVAADWPLYLAARTMGANEGRSELLTVPGTGDLALFTSERGLDDFARLHRKSGVQREALECVHLLPRWRTSFFHIAQERFLGVRIDVGSAGGGDGVHLDGKGLDGALERLEERLRPRVAELRSGR